MRFAKKALLKAPAADAVDHRGRSTRTWTITEMRFHEGALYVAGLSNEEFASTLRKIAFPFSDADKMTSLEVFHGAHGKLETHAPIRTFLHTTLSKKEHVLASYSCTPLVTFGQDEIVDGARVQGKTIAELGAGNVPLAMSSFEWQGETHFLIANNRRGLMRISQKDIETYNAKPGIMEEVSHGWTSAGVPYAVLPYTGIYYLDRLNADYTSLLYRKDDGSYHLDTGRPKDFMAIFE